MKEKEKENIRLAKKIKELKDKGEKVEQIAWEMDLSTSSVYSLLRKYYPDSLRKRPNDMTAEDKERAQELRKNGMSVKSIAKELGYSRSTISKVTKAVSEKLDNAILCDRPIKYRTSSIASIKKKLRNKIKLGEVVKVGKVSGEVVGLYPNIFTIKTRYGYYVSFKYIEYVNKVGG